MLRRVLHHQPVVNPAPLPLPDVDAEMSFTRAQCRGEIIGCEKCKELFNDRGGFCNSCGRPLDKEIGDTCGVAYAYVERGYVWRGKVRVKCRFCKRVNVI